MMRDFVDHHVVHQRVQVFPGFDPLHQNGHAEQQDRGRVLRCVLGRWHIQAGQIQRIVDIHLAQNVVVGDVFHQNGGAAHMFGQMRGNAGQCRFCHGDEVFGARGDIGMRQRVRVGHGQRISCAISRNSRAGRVPPVTLFIGLLSSFPSQTATMCPPGAPALVQPMNHASR